MRAFSPRDRNPDARMIREVVLGRCNSAFYESKFAVRLFLARVVYCRYARPCENILRSRKTNRTDFAHSTDFARFHRDRLERAGEEAGRVCARIIIIERPSVFKSWSPPTPSASLNFPLLGHSTATFPLSSRCSIDSPAYTPMSRDFPRMCKVFDPSKRERHSQALNQICRRLELSRLYKTIYINLIFIVASMKC